jgi:catechol 2,3-dioxygenase-like lactoylglutathione lyase family enzyme
MALEFSVHEMTVAVKDIDTAAGRLSGAFHGVTDPVQTFTAPMFQLLMGGVWIGDFHIAMVTDPTGEGPVGRFLAKRGEGIYEVNVRTNDLPAAIEHLKSQGVGFINDEPEILRNYDAGHGRILSELRIAFADPSTTHGVLFEIAEWVD